MPTSLDISYDMWKSIVNLIVDPIENVDDKNITLINVLVKISLLCKSGAVFVRQYWELDNVFLRRLNEWDWFQKNISDSLVDYSILSSCFPHCRDVEMSTEKMRCMFTVFASEYCSMCKEHIGRGLLNSFYIIGKKLCYNCKMDCFVSYKELYLKYGLNLALAFNKELIPIKYKRKKQSSLFCYDTFLDYYFKSGGFAVKFSSKYRQRESGRNSWITVDEYSHVFFDGPVILFWKLDIYRIFDLEKLKKFKDSMMQSQLLASLKRKFVEKRIANIYLADKIFVLRKNVELSAWDAYIIRNFHVIQCITSTSRIELYKMLQYVKQGGNVNFYKETGRKKVTIKPLDKTKLESVCLLKSKKMCIVENAKPGYRARMHMEKMCAEILNFGFGMSNTEYLKKMEILYQSMEKSYTRSTWAFC